VLFLTNLVLLLNNISRDRDDTQLGEFQELSQVAQGCVG